MTIISSLINTPGKSISSQNSETIPPALPEDILFHIFARLPFKDLWSCGQVCKGWRSIASDPILWQKRSRIEKTPTVNKRYLLKKQNFFAKQKEITIRKIRNAHFHQDFNRYCVLKNFVCIETDAFQSKIYDINSNKLVNKKLCVFFSKKLKLEVLDLKESSAFKVLSCRVSQYAATCFLDNGAIVILDRIENRTISQFQPNHGLRLVEIFDKAMVELYDNNIVCSFDKRTYTFVASCQIEGQISSFTAAHKQNLIAAGFENGSFKVWNAETLSSKYESLGHTKKVTALAIQRDNLVSGSEDGQVRLWKLYENKIVLVRTHYFSFGIQGLVLHRHIMVCGGSKRLAIQNLVTNQTKTYVVSDSVQSISLVKSNIILRVLSGIQIWKFQKKNRLLSKFSVS